jgi:molecular chaperone DnaK
MSDKSETHFRIGIDFGTTNSKIAYWFLDEPCVIYDDDKEINTPSVVYFKEDGTILVGKDAKKNLILYPERTVYSVKRKMGIKHRYHIDNNSYPPEYIGALIFRELLSIAKKQTGIEFNEAVISVPANFSDGQRYAIKDAAEIAGLNVVRMINEPTAAALAYGLHEEEKKIILVYDFGGGTFDVSVLIVEENFFNVEASSGINKLGGDDIDERIVKYLQDIIKKEHAIDIQKDLKSLQLVRTAAEAAKIELSTSKSTFVEIPFLKTKSDGTPIGFRHELNRDTLNGLIKDLIEETEKPVKNILKNACLTLDDLDDIILVGGTTKIPAVRDFIKERFEKEPQYGLDPHEVVAIGAAITTIEGFDIKEQNKVPPIEISDVIPHSFGVRVFPNDIEKIIHKNEKIPISRSKPFTNFVPFTPELKVEAYQGEYEIAVKKNFLGSFLIEVPPKPSGYNKLNVNFEVGKEYGILNVSAKDMDTGLERRVRLEAKGRLSNQQKMMWIKRISDENFVSVIISDEKQKIETTLFINQQQTIAHILQNLMYRKFISPDSKQNPTLYFKNQLLKNEQRLADFTSKDYVRFEIKYS